MIVQPSPIGPRSRPRRLLRVAGLVIPVALLVAVAGVGLLGPVPDPEPGSGAPTDLPGVAVAETAGPRATPAANAEVAGPAFPTRVGGLDVQGVRWTLEARTHGLAQGVIAVAGYLVPQGGTASCATEGDRARGAFCRRYGILADGPWTGEPLPDGGPPPYHLHAQFPPGVPVPFIASKRAGGAGGARPVVVLARFDDSRAEPCVPNGGDCGLELVVERVAWFDGDEFPREVTVEPMLAVENQPGAELRRQAAYAVSSLLPRGYALLTVLVDRATLRAMHPDAAAGLDDDRPVWYVRGLRAAGGPNRIDWLVVDAVNELTLAHGSIATNR